MQSKSSVAFAAIVALAASANAVEMSKGITLPNVGIVNPSMGAMKTATLPSLPEIKVSNIETGFSAASVISQIPGAEKQTPLAVLQNNANIQIITSQDVKAQDSKPGALTAVFDNGSTSVKPVAVVEGKAGNGVAPLAAHTVTPASKGLSRIAYGSYGLANAGTAWDSIKRFWSAFWAKINIFSKKVNTPELAAETYLTDLKDRSVKMQALVAGAAKSTALLRIQVKDEAAKIKELSDKRDAALKANRDDVAAMYDGQLEPMEASHATNKEQLVIAEKNLENAKLTLKEFVQKREAEFSRVQAKLGEVKAKQARAELDKLKSTMNMGTVESKDEFDRAANDAIAGAEGESEANTATGQTEIEDFERDMEKAKAKERLEQRKKELGLGGTEDKK